ncbi:Dabb family protein [Arenibacter latericius]|uniref:Dabb family protein n=1 Tax=Arenibacter latericius TaxID=86104 RepID=UPI000421571A|nr:Dabb family protein [Arenibacter latericius]MDX1365403.1 Dabb family protein [Arenibacter latericius]
MKNIFLGILFLTMTVVSGQTDEKMKQFDSNFVHTVYFWLKNPDNAEDRKAFETSLKKFLDHSQYAKTKFIGTPPKASRDVVDGSFTYSLVVTFESAEAQEKYQKEEPHLLFVKESSDLWTKVIVYDSTSI